jgi:leucyl/phenylalanyl-tRNA---protein transferase
MAVFRLSDTIIFPPVHLANEDGLLAVGGNLSAERILTAYSSGIFPWYNEQPILWWSPDPRFVLFPDQLHISKSMQQVLRKKVFQITVNKDFKSVISHCRITARREQQGTWITDEMQAAYQLLHEMGYAHSVEAWTDNKLVGGLYGLRIGNIFFGESMFSLVSNASKAAFIEYVKHLKATDCQLVDCQVYTDHLASLGARGIPRKEFMRLLEKNMPADKIRGALPKETV